VRPPPLAAKFFIARAKVQALRCLGTDDRAADNVVAVVIAVDAKVRPAKQVVGVWR
jgi:hypothetical protein